MKKINFVHSIYFNGNEVSDYGKKQGYVDFGTFTKSLNMVLNNDLMATLENDGYYFENINIPDYSDEIEEIDNKIESLEEKYNDHVEMLSEVENETDENIISKMMNDIQDELDTLKEEKEKYQDYEIDDIFQYYIIDNQAAEIFQEYTNYPVYYNDQLDIYFVGITHYGTAWSYVLTDIKLNMPYDYNGND